MSLLAKIRSLSQAVPEAKPKVSLSARMGRTSVAIPEDQVISSSPRWGGKPVGMSTDLERILALARRTITPADAEALAEKWTLKLRRPGGKQRLFPIQGVALEELSIVGGALNPIGVGHGKTLLDCLAAMVVPGCRYAVLLIPPSLRSTFAREWAKYADHWQLPNLADGRYFITGRPSLHVVAYSELSSAKSTDLLERIRPDLIIADEAHSVKRRTAARTKRFLRYFESHPETRFAAWSGTLTSKSLRDYAHLSKLALREGSPVPNHWPTVEEWASALDPVPFPAPMGQLRRLCEVGETVRSGFRRRLVSSPGVVATEEGAIEASLLIHERRPAVPLAVQQALEDVRSTWQRPDGEELVDGLALSRCARELACGFFLRWKWPRGEPEDVIDLWLLRRKEWHKELRGKLKFAGEFLDSPMLLGLAAKRYYDGYKGDMPVWKSETWRGWREVEDTAQPETEAVWIDDFLIKDAAEWARTHTGIVWYDSDEVGRKLAAEGLKHFGPGKEASEMIEREDGKRSIVASIRSHGTGKNLQPFAHNLIVQLPSDGAACEQLLGRTHRKGQIADEVEATVYRHTREMAASFDAARRSADYIQSTMGTQQKLIYASFTFDLQSDN